MWVIVILGPTELTTRFAAIWNGSQFVTPTDDPGAVYGSESIYIEGLAAAKRADPRAEAVQISEPP